MLRVEQVSGEGMETAPLLNLSSYQTDLRIIIEFKLDRESGACAAPTISTFGNIVATHVILRPLAGWTEPCVTTQRNIAPESKRLHTRLF